MSSTRPSYKAMVAWIALNDEPTSVDIRRVREQTTVALVADATGRQAVEVAADVVHYRERHAGNR